MRNLAGSYEHFVEYVSGDLPDPKVQPATWGTEDPDRREGLELYRTQYLPYEILVWGGDLRMMFPRGCQLLDEHNVPLRAFCDFWFSHSRPSEVLYDFFLVKIDIFEEFFHQVLPEFLSVVQEEVAMLRQGYAVACESGDGGEDLESSGGVQVEEKSEPTSSRVQQEIV